MVLPFLVNVNRVVFIYLYEYIRLLHPQHTDVTIKETSATVLRYDDL